MRAFLPCLALLTPALAGCTGLTFGENTPGADTYLEHGSIAVDDQTETAFVLGTAAPTADAPAESKILYAVDPDSGRVRRAADLTDQLDARILFPESGVLIMGEREASDELRLLDRATFEVKASRQADARYRGTRLSGSRRWLAAADDSAERAPLHLIDTASPDLSTRVIPQDGDWMEAMWLHGQERLFAIVFHGMNDYYLNGKAGARARILSWSMEALEQQGFAKEAGVWAAPEVDIALPDTTGDQLFSFTWVGVSPDDRWVVFPVIHTAPAAQHELVVLDTQTGAIRTVPDAQGPVGFTPDSATIVSYNQGATTQSGDPAPQLLLIDVETLAIGPEPVPIEGGIQFFISHAGNYVVVASSIGDQELTLVDLDQGKQTRMSGPQLGLSELVSRTEAGELWLVDDQALFRLDLNAGLLEQVPIGFAPQHINILPARDRLVLDDTFEQALYYIDPESKQLTRTVPLPIVE